jgi:hypothetical protein
LEKLSGTKERDRSLPGHGIEMPLMSALGQKRTSHQVRVMSVLPPKADIAGEGVHGIARRFGVDESDGRHLQNRF